MDEWKAARMTCAAKDAAWGMKRFAEAVDELLEQWSKWQSEYAAERARSNLKVASDD